MSDESDRVQVACDVEICTVPWFSKVQRDYLKNRGVRYIGESFYLFYAKQGRSEKVGAGIRSLIVGHYDILNDERLPLERGWRPRYWDDPAFIAELNTFILARKPTSPPPNWKEYIEAGEYLTLYHRQFLPHSRGVARRQHEAGIHAVGEILTKCKQEHPNRPSNMREPGVLMYLRSPLSHADSFLWQGCLIPPSWSPPNWEEAPLWQQELADIEREKRELDVYLIPAREKAQKASDLRERLCEAFKDEILPVILESQLMDTPIASVASNDSHWHEERPWFAENGLVTLRDLALFLQGESGSVLSTRAWEGGSGFLSECGVSLPPRKRM